MGASLVLTETLVTSTGGLIGRAMAITAVAWIVASNFHLFRSQVQRSWYVAVTALALAIMGFVGMKEPDPGLLALVMPLIFFSSQFGSRRAVLLKSSIYFVGFAMALLISGNLGLAAFGLFPAVLIISYIMQLTAELIGRHERTLVRHRELSGMSGVLISAEAVDEVQSAAVISGAALAAGMKNFTFGVFDIEPDGTWNLAASVGHDGASLRTVEFKGTDLEQALLAVRSAFVHTESSVELVPIVGDALLGALVWVAGESFDEDFRSSAETLASQMAESIRRLEAQDSIRSLLEHSIDVLIVINEEGKIEFASPAVEPLTGRTPGQVIGRSLSSLVHRQHVTQLVKHLHGNVVEPTVYNLRWGHQTNGSWKETYTTISLLRQRGSQRRWVFNVHDVSTQTALEVELRHAQKLESVGRLAAGVAHEINTPIQFIGHNLRFVGTSFDEFVEVFGEYADAVKQHAPQEVQEALASKADDADVDYLRVEIPVAVSQAIEGADRVAEIVRAMKVFGHPDGSVKQAVDLNGALASTLIIAQNEIKTIANVETNFGDVPSVMGFAGDLNQVFLNLVVNACQAMEAVAKQNSELGTLTVSTFEEDGSVTVAVSDTGTGIPQSARDHIFEPFFTTKDVGQGTGQGLALAHAVIEDRHGGRIWFESHEGKGTTFFVKLQAGTDNPKGVKHEAVSA